MSNNTHQGQFFSLCATFSQPAQKGGLATGHNPFWNLFYSHFLDTNKTTQPEFLTSDT